MLETITNLLQLSVTGAFCYLPYINLRSLQIDDPCVLIGIT